MKKAVIAVLCLCAVLLSCSGHRAPQIKVGFVLSTMQEARYVKDRQFFVAAAETLGAAVLFDEANNDERLQMEKVENMLAQGADVLVIQPCNSDAAAAFVDMAHKDSVPVIAYDRIINNCDLDCYLTQDSYRVGTLQAEAMVEWMQKTRGKVAGNIIVCSGQAGHSVANEITRGNLDVIKKYPDLHVVMQQNHSAWAPAQALQTVEDMLTKHKNNIQAVLCNNSGMARGAVQAVKEQGLTQKVFTAGADADLLNCQMVLKGEQTVEVLKGIIPLARKAAEVAVNLAKKEPLAADLTMNNGKKDVPTIVTPVDLVTRDNAVRVLCDDYVARGWPPFHAREDLTPKQ
jgi:D-xylose transport system substrate-binding protein